jgi:hypothetical protein
VTATEQRSSSLANVQLSVDALGRGTILVNGEDVSGQVWSVATESEVGKVTVVHVRVRANATRFEGPGVVYVHDELTTDARRAAVVEFLESVDLGELERGCLAGADLGDEGPIGAALRLLLEAARHG